jgi:cytochrome P450
VYLPETAEVKGFRLRCEKMVADRQKLGTSRKDIFRHFLAEDSETGAKFTQSELNANANLIIIAGAHTASSTLTQTFRMMAKEPRIWKKLQKEIDKVCENGGTLTVDSTKNLTYLNAVVNEALRLLNPLPSGIQATTSPDGLKINGVFLPGNIQVQIPHIVLMTDERYFPEGEEFIPERWTEERPELLLEKKAFIPFGYGVHSCVGKQLALNEMRLVIARVARDFDVEFGESYDDGKFLAEWMDYAVLKIGALPLKFLSRR